MPVLHYLPVLGGFEVFLKNIVERVGKHTDITVLTGRVVGVPSVEQKEHATIVRKASLYPLRDLSYTSYWYIVTALPFLFFGTLWRVVTRQATLLHANGSFSGMVCFCVHILTRVPYVMTIQSADFTIYHEEVRLNVIVRLQAWVERLVFRHAAVCHAVSNDLCEHYRRQGVSRCVMIPNGVEMELFKPITSSDERGRIRDQFGIPRDAFVISNISRLEPKNGVVELLDALAIVKEKHANIFLVLIGDGSKRQELERCVTDKGLTHKVKFVGQVSYGSVGPLVTSSDAFVRTPRSEGFGIVFLEAMAGGVPVVGTRTGGITDFIHDGETGLLCEVQNPQSIADVLTRLVENAPLRTRLSENALQLVKEHYDWGRIAEKFETEVYERAL